MHVSIVQDIVHYRHGRIIFVAVQRQQEALYKLILCSRVIGPCRSRRNGGRWSHENNKYLSCIWAPNFSEITDNMYLLQIPFHDQSLYMKQLALVIPSYISIRLLWTHIRDLKDRKTIVSKLTSGLSIWDACRTI